MYYCMKCRLHFAEEDRRLTKRKNGHVIWKRKGKYVDTYVCQNVISLRGSRTLQIRDYK